MPRQTSLCLGLSVISLPFTGHHVCILCFCVSYQFIRGPSMCRNYPVSLQVFFRKNCYICRYRFNASTEGDELRVFLYYHLRTLSQQWLLDPTQKIHSMKETTDKLYFIRIKNFSSMKDIVKKISQATDWEIMFVRERDIYIYICKGILFKIHQEILTLNNKGKIPELIPLQRRYRW